MKDRAQLFDAIKQLALQRDLSQEDIIRAIKESLEAVCRKKFGTENLRVEIDPVEQTVKVIKFEDVETPEGVERREEEIRVPEFGRLLSVAAKQYLMSRINEIEREKVYREYKDRIGELVVGTVKQTDRRFTILDLVNTEALLPPEEQMPRDRYTRQSRVKAVIVDVRNRKNEPQVIVSRTHPALVKRLFELEVPEIQEGLCEIKAVAREPGFRTKIAVASNDRNVDPTGACVGPKGVRVKQVVKELSGEKVDVVAWDPDPARFVANALGPARVSKVVVDKATQTAYVIVPEDQLSLAIGKEGQNARLAAKLTNFRIDIKSEAEAEEFERQQAELIQKEREIEEKLRATIEDDLAAALFGAFGGEGEGVEGELETSGLFFEETEEVGAEQEPKGEGATEETAPEATPAKRTRKKASTEPATEEPASEEPEKRSKASKKADE
jgi:N utilization substance protein A